MVHKDWVHPTYINPYRGEEPRPMYARSHEEAVAEWKDDKVKWDNRTHRYYDPEDYEGTTFEEEFGEMPDAKDYMPNWKPEKRTHMMMYENTSEGTPISPAFEKPEDLARWLADNGASAFGKMTASYEDWLKMCKPHGFSIGAVISGGRMMSGVEAMGVQTPSEASPEEENNA